MILKPSERDPGAAAILVELAERAGVPPGVLNLVHGAVDTVNFICDAPEIKAISFVGGNVAGSHIADRAGKNGKRVQVSLYTSSRKDLVFNLFMRPIWEPRVRSVPGLYYERS